MKVGEFINYSTNIHFSFVVDKSTLLKENQRIQIHIYIYTHNSIRELIPVQHFYNKCTTVLSHRVGPTVYGAHPM